MHSLFYRTFSSTQNWFRTYIIVVYMLLYMQQIHHPTSTIIDHTCTMCNGAWYICDIIYLFSRVDKVLRKRVEAGDWSGCFHRGRGEAKLSLDIINQEICCRQSITNLTGQCFAFLKTRKIWSKVYNQFIY